MDAPRLRAGHAEWLKSGHFHCLYLDPDTRTLYRGTEDHSASMAMILHHNDLAGSNYDATLLMNLFKERLAAAMEEE